MTRKLPALIFGLIIVVFSAVGAAAHNHETTGHDQGVSAAGVPTADKHSGYDIAAQVSVSDLTAHVKLQANGGLTYVDWSVPQPAKDGEGHWHLALDNGPVVKSQGNEHTFAGLSGGAHTLKVSFQHNDHKPYSPPLEKIVAFEVVPPIPNPSFSIVSPVENVELKSGTVELSLDLKDGRFVSSSKAAPPKKGEGHWHVWIDNAQAPLKIDGNSYLIKDLVPGEHTVRVAFVNNDHKPYGPELEKTVKFKVSVASPALSTIYVGIGALLILALAAGFYMKSSGDASHA